MFFLVYPFNRCSVVLRQFHRSFSKRPLTQVGFAGLAAVLLFCAILFSQLMANSQLGYAMELQKKAFFNPYEVETLKNEAIRLLECVPITQGGDSHKLVRVSLALTAANASFLLDGDRENLAQRFNFALRRGKKNPTKALQVISAKHTVVQSVQRWNTNGSVIQFVLRSPVPLATGSYDLHISFDGNHGNASLANETTPAQERWFAGALQLRPPKRKLSLLFLVDNSASMMRNDAENARFTKIVSIFDQPKVRQKLHEIAVFGFADQVEKVVELVGVADADKVKIAKMSQALKRTSSLVAQGKHTDFSKAFVFLHNFIAKQRAAGNKDLFKVVFLTDGVPTTPFADQHRRVGFGTSIYTVGLSRDGVNENYDEDLLKAIARETGGKFFSGKSGFMGKLYNALVLRSIADSDRTKVRSVKENYGIDEMVRLEILSLNRLKNFKYELSSRSESGKWGKAKTLTPALVSEKDAIVAFMPFDAGKHRIFVTAEGRKVAIGFRVAKHEKPFQAVSRQTEPYAGLYFNRLSPSTQALRYARLYTKAQKPIELHRFDEHLFLLSDGNGKYHRANFLFAKQSGREIEIEIYPLYNSKKDFLNLLQSSKDFLETEQLLSAFLISKHESGWYVSDCVLGYTNSPFSSPELVYSRLKNTKVNSSLQTAGINNASDRNIGKTAMLFSRSVVWLALLFVSAVAAIFIARRLFAVKGQQLKS